MDFVLGFPFGKQPFGDEVFDIPTFCRPRYEMHEGLNAEHAAKYTADLEERIAERYVARRAQLLNAASAVNRAIDASYE
jgi:hypothetical protein